MDIYAFLNDYGISYQTKGRNLSRGRLGFCCPFCSDTGYHAAFTSDGKITYCWRCGWHPTDKTLQLLSGLSSYEYRNIIGSYDGTDSLLSSLNKKVANATTLELPGSPGLLPHDRKYLKKRKFDPDYLMEKYKIRSGGICGDWAWRIIIPIFYKGQLVSWQGRTTNDDDIRYKTLAIEKSIMDAKSVLYNIDNCKHDYIGVNEGPLDTIRMGSDFVATLGTSMTEAQCRMLATYKRVVFVFDPDPVAQGRAKKYAERVAALGAMVSVLDLQMDKDPGELNEEEVKDVRNMLDFQCIH